MDEEKMIDMYADQWLDITKDLSEAQAKSVLEAVILYGLFGEFSKFELDDESKIAFDTIRRDIFNWEVK
jgi:hypothetical protein